MVLVASETLRVRAGGQAQCWFLQRLKLATKLHVFSNAQLASDIGNLKISAQLAVLVAQPPNDFLVLVIGLFPRHRPQRAASIRARFRLVVACTDRPAAHAQNPFGQLELALGAVHDAGNKLTAAQFEVLGHQPPHFIQQRQNVIARDVVDQVKPFVFLGQSNSIRAMDLSREVKEFIAQYRNTVDSDNSPKT
ncbi:hypothetical protein [Pseudomonas sp.]|uniref:hypothetical protein n=1 Tax=Pseudomonas sp. TaxID=306 RepID=UPI004053FCC9